jgi:hypothetical protein
MAEQFVRYRDVSLLDDNLRRMECQKLYINSFASQTVSAIRDDLQVPIKLYQHSSENTVTNINTPILTYLAISLASNYKGLNITSVKGKYVDSPDDDFAEYKINKRNLFETVLDIFYEKTD